MRDSVKAYLFTAARHHALNDVRRQRLRATWEEAAARDETLGSMGQEPAAADSTTNVRDLDRALRQAIAALPPRCREAYLLTREHQMSYAETAAVLGVAPKTVGVQVGIALRMLRRHLADWVGE